MNSPEDKKLDEMITNAIGGKQKTFDFEAFKDKHYDEIADFQRQAADLRKYPNPIRLDLVVFARLAAAAMILIAIGLFICNPIKKPDTPAPPVKTASSMSLINLNMAYRKGGMDEVEKQYKKANAELGPRTDGVSLDGLFKEL